MSIEFYLNLLALLQDGKVKHIDNRAFGIKYPHKSKSKLLILWHSHFVSKEETPLGSSVKRHLSHITLFLLIISAFIGMLVGLTLLSYSGSDPINIIYFLFMSVAIPLFSMMVSLMMMLFIDKNQSNLLSISPSFLLEKIVNLFFKNSISEDIKLPPIVLNWLLIVRSQMMALSFSVGVLLALIVMVVTKDIAFVWSTTLQVDALWFHHFVDSISMFWSSIYPDAVPSLQLVEQSQYFRLGDSISGDMLSSASSLGEWWKFLAFSLLFYAIFLRIIVLIVANIGLSKSVENAIFLLDEVDTLLEEMKRDVLTTHSLKSEARDSHILRKNSDTVKEFSSFYGSIQGWSMSDKELFVLVDATGLKSDHQVIVGGLNTLEMDSNIIEKSSGDILIFVKSWETPTMDFVDYVDELSLSCKSIMVSPVGMIQDGYISSDRDMKIWSHKITSLDNDKVRFKI